MLNLSLGTVAALQLGSNLALQLVLLRLLGAGEATDAYIAAQTVPVLLFSVLAVSLQNVWQPRLAVLHDDLAGWRAAQSVAQGQVFLLMFCTSSILLVAAPAWVPLMFPGFGPARLELTTTMTQVLLIGTVLNGHAALFTAAQRARERFLAAEIVPLLASLLLLGVVAVSVGRFGIEMVAWASVVRSAAVCIVLYWMAGRPVPSIVQAIRSADVWKQVGPVLAGSSLYKTGPVIDRFWTSQAPAGSVTMFNLVQTAMTAVASILDRSIGVAAAPQLARLAHSGDMQGMLVLYRSCIRRTTLAVALLLIALLASYPIWSDVVVAVLRIQEPFATQMWVLSLALLGYLHVAACGYVVVAVFYALGDTRTPVRISTLSFMIGAVVKSVAFIRFGVTGLALATSIYYVANLIVMCVLVEKRIRAQVS